MHRVNNELLKSFYNSQRKEKGKIYKKYIAMLQTVVEGTDAYNSLGFATRADCCFLVSSVRI